MNKIDAELLQILIDIRVAIGDLDNSLSNLMKIEHHLVKRFQCAPTVNTKQSVKNTSTAENSKTITAAEYPPVNNGKKRDVY